MELVLLTDSGLTARTDQTTKIFKKRGILHQINENKIISRTVVKRKTFFLSL